MKKNRIDLAISARWIIPVVPADTIFEDCTLLVHETRIVGIVPSTEFHALYAADTHTELPEHVLIPGLINTHGHAAMSLLRGYANDYDLKTWLEDYIWPTEATRVSDDFVYDGTQLAIAEMLLSGTTCFSDHYFFPEATARAVHESGIRAQIAFPVLDIATNWAADANDCIEKGLVLRDNYRSHPRIRIAFGPHAPYTVGDAALKKIGMYANELEMPIHMHVHETESEVSEALAKTSQRPLARLAELGLMSPLTQCVHMTHIDDTDIDVMKNSGAHVIHCPSSNMKLASGTCPVTILRTAGVNVALGTDGAASNNALSVFSEAMLASLLAKSHDKNAASLTASETLRMATLDGAKALGIDAETGSLEAGKVADICAVDLSALSQQPVHNVIAQLIYTDCSSHVRHTWVNGKQLVKDRTLLTLNEHAIKEKTQQWREKIHHDEY